MRRHSSNLTGGDSVPASGLSNFKDELAYILMGRQAAHFTCLFNQRVSLPHACCSNITHLMSSISAVYMRLPNWIGDVCMSLPSLEAVLATGIPVIVCARGWARDLLSGYDLAGFVEMKGRWREDRAAVHSFRKKAGHAHPRGLLLPDSLSSAMVFSFAGVPSAGYRDDGRSLILRWPVAKPLESLHAVESWYYLTSQALRRWGCAAPAPRPARQLGRRPAGRRLRACGTYRHWPAQGQGESLAPLRHLGAPPAERRTNRRHVPASGRGRRRAAECPHGHLSDSLETGSVCYTHSAGRPRHLQ